MTNFQFRKTIFTGLCALGLMLTCLTQASVASGRLSWITVTPPGGSSGSHLDGYMSYNGRYVTFLFMDGNGVRTLYVKDRTTGAVALVNTRDDTTRINCSPAYPSVEVNEINNNVRVVFSGICSEGNVLEHIYLKEFTPNLTPIAEKPLILLDTRPDGQPVTVYSSSQPRLSGNGQYVAFRSDANDFFLNASGNPVYNRGQVYRIDLNNLTRNFEVISVPTGSAAPPGGNVGSGHPAMSKNGRFVAFDSASSNLVATIDGANNIFLRDTVGQATSLVSIRPSAQTAGDSRSSDGYPHFSADVSDDGNMVVFTSSVNFTGNNPANVPKIYLRNMNVVTNGITYVGELKADGSVTDTRDFEGNISGDGRFITHYTSNSPGNISVTKVFDRLTNSVRTIEAYNLENASQGLTASYPVVSGNGRLIQFQSVAKLVETDTVTSGDIYVYDMVSSKAKPDPGDFDADGVTDYAYFRPSDGTWNVKYSSNGQTQTTQLGVSGDKPMPGDYDGDGKTDVAVFRPSNGTWYIKNSSSGSLTTQAFGQAGDIPVAADYNGDNYTDIAVFRPSNGSWYIQSTASPNKPSVFSSTQFGINGDRPVVGDYDRDNYADIAVFRPSNGNWYIRTTAWQNSSGVNHPSVNSSLQFGSNGDIPAAGDYDGDGKTNITVFRPSNGTWYLSLSASTFSGTVFGQNGDVPTSGDYDNDGKSDFAVFRSSNAAWYALRSSNSALQTLSSFGTNGDIPVPNSFFSNSN